MAWLVGLIILTIAIVLAIIFLNRFYRKSTREVALVRTGAGGQQVVLDGGCLALPFLHKVSEVNMKTTQLEIERLGPKSMITKDRLRVDAAVEFYVRVKPTEEGVATAAQALAGKSFRASELAETLEGKLVDAMLSVAAGYTMDSLQDERGRYVAEVSDALQENLAQNGLVLESVSLTRLDQTPFHALDENNAFNALGMRRLAEIIAVNQKERAEIESDADVSVRQSYLDATKRKLLIEQEEEQAMIAQQREIETSRAASHADVAEQQAAAELRRENARIDRERDVRSGEIERDRSIRALETESSLKTETAQIDKAIQLAAKRIDEAKAKTKTQAALAEEIAAQEGVETERQKAVADREKELALIRAREQAEVDDTRVASESGTIRAMAQAEARAVVERAKAQKDELLAEAEGKAAVIQAENAQSEELIRMKLDMARLETLPDLVGKMLKPAEKIESIRINHITGFGNGGSSGGGGGDDKAVVNQVVDGVLGMALQMPAVKKLGEEVGLNIASGVSGLSDSVDDSPETPAAGLAPAEDENKEA
ncbi:MAG: flotillin domain-containing protein [Pseudomonadota bacterium]